MKLKMNWRFSGYSTILDQGKSHLHFSATVPIFGITLVNNVKQELGDVTSKTEKLEFYLLENSQRMNVTPLQ